MTTTLQTDEFCFVLICVDVVAKRAKLRVRLRVRLRVCVILDSKKKINFVNYIWIEFHFETQTKRTKLFWLEQKDILICFSM